MSTDDDVTNSDTEQSTDIEKEPIEWDELSPDRQHELVGLAKTLGTEETTEVVDEEGETWTVGALADLGMTRRQALIAFAALAAGYSLRDAIVRAVIGEARADSNQAGTYGTAANPGDFYSEDHFAKNQTSLSTPPSGYVNFGYDGSWKYKDSGGSEYSFGGVQNPMQANLDAGGNDITNAGTFDGTEFSANEGTITSTPSVAVGSGSSIQSAIENGPLTPQGDRVDITLSDTSYTEEVVLDELDRTDYIRIVGQTDGSGNPNTTVTSPAGNATAADIRGPGTVILENLVLTSGDTVTLNVWDGCAVLLKNCIVEDGGTRAAYYQRGSIGIVDSDSTVRQTIAGTSDVITAIGGAYLRLEGTVTANGDESNDRALTAWQGVSVYSSGEIDAAGLSRCASIQDGSDAEFVGTYRNATNVARVAHGATAKLNGTLDTIAGPNLAVVQGGHGVDQNASPTAQITSEGELIKPSNQSSGVYENHLYDPADGTAQAVSDRSNSPAGILFLVDPGSGKSAILELQGGLDTVAVLAQSGSRYGTSSGAAGINVYHNGTQYQVENNTGGSISVVGRLVRTGGTV